MSGQSVPISGESNLEALGTPTSLNVIQIKITSGIKNLACILILVLAFYDKSSSQDIEPALSHLYESGKLDSCISRLSYLLNNSSPTKSQKIELLNLLGRSYVSNYQYEKAKAYIKALQINTAQASLSKDEYIDTTKINTLKIIPDGILSLIPFETLITEPSNTKAGDYKSLSYLIRKFNISYGYSSTSLFKQSDMAKDIDHHEVLAFAPSAFVPSEETSTLAALKWNQKELDHLSGYFSGYSSSGGEATEADFKTKVQQYPIAHLAMHAVVNHEDPMYSKLLFAPPHEQDTLEDGMLHTFELYNMRLNTQMVVLSACNTGYGKLQKGEGVMSLARAFAYAGCPSVVMSHWAVDDKSTAELMKYFYQHLAEGETKDAALRKAKLDFLDNSSPLYHHPYYWNNFVVLGDIKPVSQQASYQWVTLLLTMVGFAMVFYGFRRYADER